MTISEKDPKSLHSLANDWHIKWSMNLPITKNDQSTPVTISTNTYP